ncbi:MAG: GUN4 domain-containing protein [Rivularia sp. (in: cyanobacteria)]|jgi:DNA-binding helix-hairpin-helix protein with protein kinase domain
MQQLFDSHGQNIVLEAPRIASSGEGEVWKTNRYVNGKRQLAKLYHQNTLTRDRINKLKLLTQNSPLDPNANRGHISFAWPQSLLFNNQHQEVGFLMPEIPGANNLLRICNPRLRQQKGLKIDWYFLHTVALNIASIIQAIHEYRAYKYVLGDIKLENILVNSQALPSIIDVDSFQVNNPQTGQIYHCLVGSEGFTPAELFGKEFSQEIQSPSQDNFRLGIVIYYLLFGEHPFQGVWKGKGEAPDKNQLVHKGFWPYAPKNRRKLEPSLKTIPLKILHPELEQSFLQCFNDGHDNPSQRPTAQEWVKSLEAALQTLHQCAQVDSHWYSSQSEHYKQSRNCYWCERAKNLGVDIFPEIISFNRLGDFLNKKDWKQADLETKLLLLKLTKRQAEGWLDEKSIKNLKVEFLKELDRLWRNASKNHFGFSIQKQIYLQTGNQLDRDDWQTYRKFGQQVGWWEQNTGWKDYTVLNFSDSAPKGHLPFLSAGFTVLISCIARRLP